MPEPIAPAADPPGAEAPFVDNAFRGLPGSERTKPRIRARSLVAALLLYLLLLALVVYFPEDSPVAPPAPIPVRIVNQLPPPPPPPPAAKPQAKPQPEPPAPQERPLTRSGEDKETTAPAPAKQAEEERKADSTPPEPDKTAPAKAAPAPLSDAEPTPNGKLPVAKPAPPSPPKPEPPKPAARPSLSKTPSRNEFRITAPKEQTGDPYMNGLRDEIEKHRAYPPLARSLGLQGIATYRLMIDPQGRIMSLDLVESSGADILDRAGRDMILAPGRFPPPPIGPHSPGVVLLVRLPLYPD